MASYDIELIDISDEIENFKFHKLNQKDLEKVIEVFRSSKPLLEFKAMEGNILLKSSFFRGVMYSAHSESRKTTMQETMENAKEIGKINVKKAKNKVFIAEEK
jgi:hypothetical protein